MMEVNEMKDELAEEFSVNNSTKGENSILDDYYNKINKLIVDSKKRIKKNINYEMVGLYYEIGHVINELIEKYHFESSQNKIIKVFSIRLITNYGQGFGVANLKLMKKFYLTYKSTGYTLCNQLS